MRASTGSMASGAAEGVWIRPRLKRTSAIAGGRQRNPASFRLGRCRSALVREGVTGRATSRTGALLQKTVVLSARDQPGSQHCRQGQPGQRRLALCWQVGAHLCARALPGEPHRARVRSYNNLGAVGSRSAGLTAPPPGPAWPAASGPLLAGRSALVREGITGRATSRTGALLQQPWCCRLEISLAHSTAARASLASGVWPSVGR